MVNEFVKKYSEEHPMNGSLCLVNSNGDVRLAFYEEATKKWDIKDTMMSVLAEEDDSWIDMDYIFE